MASRCAARPNNVTSCPARRRKPPSTDPSAPAPAIRTRSLTNGAIRRPRRAVPGCGGSRALLQDPTEDLARRILRNLIDELDGAYFFVARHPLLDEANEIVLG